MGNLEAEVRTLGKTKLASERGDSERKQYKLLRGCLQVSLGGIKYSEKHRYAFFFYWNFTFYKYLYKKTGEVRKEYPAVGKNVQLLNY